MNYISLFYLVYIFSIAFINILMDGRPKWSSNFYITSIISAFKFSALYTSPFFYSFGIIQFIIISYIILDIIESYIYYFNVFDIKSKYTASYYDSVYSVVSTYIIVFLLYAGGFFDRY
jgi:hypothetical protein